MKDGNENGRGRDRTGDTRIFSPLLYQLSYLASAINLRGASLLYLLPMEK